MTEGVVMANYVCIHRIKAILSGTYTLLDPQAGSPSGSSSLPVHLQKRKVAQEIIHNLLCSFIMPTEIRNIHMPISLLRV